MKIRFTAFLHLLGLMILTVGTVRAQSGNTVTIPSAGAPSGGCSFLMFANDTTNGNLYFCDNTQHWKQVAGASGVGTVTNVATTSPITGGPITTTGTIACATCGVTIASGTAAMGTSAISSGACATVVTVAGTGIATTDVITVGFNGDPTGVTGYGVSATGAVLTIYPYPTAGNANFRVCNSTSASITPGALTLNWRVAR